MAEDKITIRLTKDSKGFLSCDVPITKGQWSEILRNKTVTTPTLMRVLLSFYFMPEHKASCTQCEKEYGLSYATYNIGVSHFAQAVGNLFDFQIIDESTEKPRYWPIPMGKGKEIKIDGKTQFEWQLRKELVEALEEIIIEKAIESYISEFDLYFYVERDGIRYNEKYKWEAIQWFQNNWDINNADFPAMLDNALSKTENLLASQNSFARGMIVAMAKADTNAVRQMFIDLYDETAPLEKRIRDFLRKSEELREKYNQGDWNMHYQSTNTVSIYLWLKYPDKYFIYKYSVYKDVDEAFGLGYKIKRNGKPEEMVKGYEMYKKIHQYLINNNAVKELIDSHISDDSRLYPDPKLITATGDFGYYISRKHNSLNPTLTKSFHEVAVL